MTLSPSQAAAARTAFDRLSSDLALRERLGEALDIKLTAQALGLAEPSWRPEPVWLEEAPPPGWLPAAIKDDRVSWCWFGRRVLDDGFYAHELQTARYLAINRLFAVETPLSALVTGQAAPMGLIFHMSRCGSTLAGRMLAADHTATVISEAQPVDAAMRRGDAALLRAVASAFARPRGTGEAHLFLKLDCWHSRAIRLFREAFPDTPWIFLHREPGEVMVSHARRSGSQMASSLVPPSILGLDEGNPRDPAYHAAVLASVCEGALEGWTVGGGMMVDYGELPQAMFTRVLPHFGFAPDAEVEAAMRVTAGMNAKEPGEAFTPDGEAKRREISPEIQAACEGRLAVARARLCQLSKTDVP